MCRWRDVRRDPGARRVCRPFDVRPDQPGTGRRRRLSAPTLAGLAPPGGAPAHHRGTGAGCPAPPPPVALLTCSSADLGGDRRPRPATSTATAPTTSRRPVATGPTRSLRRVAGLHEPPARRPGRRQAGRRLRRRRARRRRSGMATAPTRSPSGADRTFSEAPHRPRGAQSPSPATTTATATTTCSGTGPARTCWPRATLTHVHRRDPDGPRGAARSSATSTATAATTCSGTAPAPLRTRALRGAGGTFTRCASRSAPPTGRSRATSTATPGPTCSGTGQARPGTGSGTAPPGAPSPAPPSASAATSPRRRQLQHDRRRRPHRRPLVRAGPTPTCSGGYGHRGSFATGSEDRGGTFAAVVGDFDASSGSDVVAPAGPRPDQLWRSTRRRRSPSRCSSTTPTCPTAARGAVGPGVDPGRCPALRRAQRRLDVRLPDGTVRQLVADQSDVLRSARGRDRPLVVDPDFAANRRFYTCQGRQTGGTYDIQVVAWQVDAGYTTATRVADPRGAACPSPPSAPSPGRHSGAACASGPTATSGSAPATPAVATIPQDRASLGGKILRVDATTSCGARQPFVGDGDPRHRRPGLRLRPPQRAGPRPASRHAPDVVGGARHLPRRRGQPPPPGRQPRLGPGAASGPVFYDESRPMTDLVRHPGSVVAARPRATPPTPGAAPSSSSATSGAPGRAPLAGVPQATEPARVMWFTRDGTTSARRSPPSWTTPTAASARRCRARTGRSRLTTSEASGNVILRVTPS